MYINIDLSHLNNNSKYLNWKWYEVLSSRRYRIIHKYTVIIDSRYFGKAIRSYEPQLELSMSTVTKEQ